MDRAFDRVLLARHFALSVGALAAYVFRSELSIGYMALWIVGVSASLNFAAYFFRTRRRLARLCLLASPFIGVGGWTALIAVTNGIHSPFIAGLWLEIVLSAMALRQNGVVFVTLGSGVALWTQQVWLGLEGHLRAMVLQTGFLVGMGLATFLVTRRWSLTQKKLAHERELLADERVRLEGRLDALNRRLEDERVVAALGENVARLAHGLKNTVHSLRGFVGLIEPKLAEQGGGQAALQGLRAAIDDLEALAHLTLGSSARSRAGQAPASREKTVTTGPPAAAAAMPIPAIARALEEITTAHPRVEWEIRSDGVRPELPVAEATLVETLVILLRNAVEAMDGQGHGCVETRVQAGELVVTISDEGVGLPEGDVERIFKPGFTTKPAGSGYGLYLARRMLEEHGGRLQARSRPGKGAIVELSLPVRGTGGVAAAR